MLLLLTGSRHTLFQEENAYWPRLQRWRLFYLIMVKRIHLREMDAALRLIWHLSGTPWRTHLPGYWTHLHTLWSPFYHFWDPVTLHRKQCSYRTTETSLEGLHLWQGNLHPNVGRHSERQCNLCTLWQKLVTHLWQGGTRNTEHGYISLRRECNRARRLFQRARGRDDFAELRESYRWCRTNLNGAIAHSKRRCYREMSPM